MNTTRTCPECGKPVAATGVQGLCPECMMKVGLATETDDAGAGEVPVAGAPDSSAPPPDEIARLFPQLEIVECLGRGGMGAVYKARQPRLDRFVALKILLRRRPDGGPDTAFAERFAREARALARLNHPEIVAVYDYGEAGGYPYLVMEYVDGLTLRQLLQRGKLAPQEALAIVPKICEALQFAHQQGIVHRDIKPENILLDKQGQLKIADFGIAKILVPGAQDWSLTGAKEVVGTPPYMAPEQIEHPATVDHRADIYSLGVVFYEMLTGELPLGKFAPPSRKVHVDVRLDEVVLRALEKEPERRYQHASEVKTDVETIAQAGDLGTGAPLPQPPASPASDSRGAATRSVRTGGVLGYVALGWCVAAILGSAVLLAIPGRADWALGLAAVALVLALAFGVLNPQERWSRFVAVSSIVTLCLGVGGGAVLRHTLARRAQGRQAGQLGQSAAAGVEHQQPPDGPARPGSSPRRLLRLHPYGPVGVLAGAPDGQTLAVGGGRSMVRLLDAGSGDPIATLALFSPEEESVLAETQTAPGVEVRALAFSPDSSVVAIGNSLGQVKLFDARSGGLVRALDDAAGRATNRPAADKLLTLPRALGNVWALAFSPDGALLATCGDPMPAAGSAGGRTLSHGDCPGFLKLWDARTGALKQDLVGHSSQVHDVAFSPDGRFLASVGNWSNASDHGSGVRLWDPQTGQMVKTIRLPDNGGALSLAFSPDGRRLAIGAMRYDKATDVTSGAISVAYPASGMVDLTWLVPVSVRPVAFSSDGKFIGARSARNAVTLWDSTTGTAAHDLQLSDKAEGERWTSVAFSPKADRLAIGGVDAEQRGFVDLWELPLSVGAVEPAPKPGVDPGPTGLASVTNVGGSYGTLVSGGGPGSLVQLAGLPEVQQDLALTEAQKAAVQRALSRFQAFEQPFIQAGRTPPPSGQVAWHLARQAAHAQEVTRTSQEITQVLTSTQQRRLAEISLQDQGAEALFQPEVVKTLGLTPAQQQSLARLRKEADQQIAARMGRPRGLDGRPLTPGGGGGSRAGTSAGGGAGVGRPGAGASPITGVADIIRASERMMIEEVLTPAQQARLKELQGEPCPLKPRYRARAGGGGGGFSFSGQGSGPLP